MLSRKIWLNGLTGAVLTLCVIGAQAGPVTMTLNKQIGTDSYQIRRAGHTSWESGSGGGGFSGTLTGAGPSDLYHDQNPLLTYCVDLDHHFSLPGSYTDYSVVSAAMYLVDTTKANRLANLFTWAVGDSSTWFSDTHKSSGMQLAVWEIVYESVSNNLTLSSGDFYAGSETNVDARGFADTLLTHAGTSQANPLKIWILDSHHANDKESHQDQLFWEDGKGVQITSSVPEPMSLALTAVALAGLALTRRRG